MIIRSLLLAAFLASPVLAAPMTIVFSGNATGSVGSTAFNNQPFTITFTTDTSSITQGTSCCAKDYTTPSGTVATADFGTGGKFNLAGDQAVFVNQGESTMGIWHYNSPDFLTIGNPTFTTYTESSTLAATSGTAYSFPGAEAMATTSGNLVLQSVTNVNVAVTVGSGTPQTPVISAVGTAWSTGLAQNTFIAITGQNLAPAGTPDSGVFWSNAASFAQGILPDSLNGVTVTVNGKRAYIYFYCAASTASGAACATDQINALTPLDATTGPVQIVVSNGSASSVAKTVTMTPVSPAMLEFPKNHVAATHADFSLLGPTDLYPGLSTPASVGETVVLWTVGFGLPTGGLTAGSSTQAGSLPALPTCTINNASAMVSFAGLVGPGLYQLNVVVPNGATDGENAIKCTYQGSSTQDGLTLTVQR